MAIKIALAGNPNCGKTTLFNDLTGSNQYVGNWPGVTVEKKDGQLKGHKDVIIQDLPGIYSLSPYTLEEVVSRRYLVNDKPDAIINIIDGTNIERNLYLTTQLLELNIPTVVAINMMDLVEKNGDKINLDKLAETLGCTVVPISALNGNGCREIAEKAIEAAEAKKHIECPHVFSGSVEHALAHIEESIETKVDKAKLRWYVVKVFERDEKILEELKLPSELLEHLDEHIKDCEKEMDDDAESIITDQRYRYIQKVVEQTVKKKAAPGSLTFSDKIDLIVTNRVLALPIFAVVIWFMYWVSVSTIGTWMTDWANDGMAFVRLALEAMLDKCGASGFIKSLILDGIIDGVGTVIGFLPQIMIVFLFLAFLEDCGYMARVAFIMDRIFRRFGLSGKSFIPMLVGTGCGVPAVLATRTIQNENDRRMTIILATFIPCGAKLAIIAMMVAAFFPDSNLIGPSMYFVGIAIVILGGLALKKTKLFAGENSPFVMELPAYHLPSLKSVLIHTWERGKGYVIKAGTIIFSACVVLWLLMHFDWHFNLLDPKSAEGLEQCMLHDIGQCFAWIFKPLGFGCWQATVACASAEIAKEQATATLALLSPDVAGGTIKGIQMLFADMVPASIAEPTMREIYAKVIAFSFMVCNLFFPPCLGAIAATWSEMGSAKWGCIAIGFQLLVGYSLALVCFRLGVLIYAGASFGIGQVAAILIILAVLYAVFRPSPKIRV
ncbi:MAG: ferrous iron transport protein B [Victivallales bacterium]|nr:ferrous iron transport protein B [Victivallales bacterium]